MEHLFTDPVTSSSSGNQAPNKGIEMAFCSDSPELESFPESAKRRPWETCAKNRGHKSFIPASEFTIENLPEPYRTREYFDIVKLVSFLTVKLTIKYTSVNRSRDDPFLKSKGPRCGSGFVCPLIYDCMTSNVSADISHTIAGPCIEDKGNVKEFINSEHELIGANNLMDKIAELVLEFDSQASGDKQSLGATGSTKVAPGTGTTILKNKIVEDIARQTELNESFDVGQYLADGMNKFFRGLFGSVGLDLMEGFGNANEDSGASKAECVNENKEAAIERELQIQQNGCKNKCSKATSYKKSENSDEVSCEMVFQRSSANSDIQDKTSRDNKAGPTEYEETGSILKCGLKQLNDRGDFENQVKQPLEGETNTSTKNALNMEASIEKSSAVRRKREEIINNLMEHRVIPCPCPECRDSPSPQPIGYLINVKTARHVIFDDEEALSTTVDLFYNDIEATSVQHLYGFRNLAVDSQSDASSFICVTHSLELFFQLHATILSLANLKSNLQSSDNLPPLAVISSHPHGYFKHITVGEWTKRCLYHRFPSAPIIATSYEYTTDTCPGSSGAPVLIFGHKENTLKMSSDVHNHFGSLKRCINYSGVATGSIVSEDDLLEVLEAKLDNISKRYSYLKK